MTAVQPCLWKWQDVYDSLVRAGEVINLENSERRVVRLVNPGLDLQTRFCDADNPGLIPVRQARRKRAGASPHAGGVAIHYSGQGCLPTVNGQQCVMEPGDLILTPKLTWHDHSNEATRRWFGSTVWIFRW